MPVFTVFGRGKRKSEEEEESDKEERIEQIQVQFKAKPEDKFDTCDDILYEHFPSKEEIAEEYGGGIWRVYGRDENGRIVKQRKYNVTDQEVTYPIVGWKLKVKKDMKGKWYNTDLNYSYKPGEEEIETDLGGGGIVKIYGIDRDSKMVTQDVIKLDAEPPEWLVEMEDEVQKTLKEELAKARKSEEQKFIKKLSGDEEEGGDVDRVGKAINKLVNNFEEMQLDKFEKIVNQLTEGKEDDGQPRELSFSDVMFKQPQMRKLDAMTTVVQELAKEDPREAAKLLDKIPDASGAFVNLISAAGEALTAGSKYFSAQADAMMKEKSEKAEKAEKAEKEEEKKKPAEKERKAKKKEEKEAEDEEEKKEPEVKPEEHVEPEELEELEPVSFEVEKRETGFDITLGVEDGEVGAEK